MMAIRIITLWLASYFYFSQSALAQQHLENFLLAHELVTTKQLGLYREEIKSKRQFVLLMVKAMSKEDKDLAKELKERLKNEDRSRKNNRDTLQLLSEILEVSKEKSPDKHPPGGGQLDLLRTFGDKMFRAGLISKPAVDSILNQLGNGRLRDSFVIADYSLDLRKKLSSILPERLMGLIDLLQSQGLLTQQAAGMLKEMSLPDSINRIRYILSHCNNTILSASREFFSNETVFYQLIEDLQKLTGIKLSDVKVGLADQQKDGEYYSGRPEIEASNEGRKYRYKGNEVASSSPLTEDSKFSLDIEELFNFILASKRSVYRVYRVSEQDALDYSVYWKGFMLLTASQWEALYHSEHLDLSLVDHKSALSDEQVKIAIAKYKQLGLFSGVTATEEENVLDEIRLNPVFRYNELVSRFPSASIVVDDDHPVDEKAAAEFLERIAGLSRGQLTVSGISFSRENGRQWLNFDANGKKIRISSDEWRYLWHRIHEILAADPTKSLQVGVLRFSQRAVAYFLISEQDHDKLKNEGLIDDY